MDEKSGRNLMQKAHASPRCQAKTRAATFCCAPAMLNGRCRMHGGKSTGPRTVEGLERMRAARTIHGLYSLEYRRLAKLVRDLKVGAKSLAEEV